MVVFLLVWPETYIAGRITWRQLELLGCLLAIAYWVCIVVAL